MGCEPTLELTTLPRLPARRPAIPPPPASNRSATPRVSTPSAPMPLQVIGSEPNRLVNRLTDGRLYLRVLLWAGFRKTVAQGLQLSALHPFLMPEGYK